MKTLRHHRLPGAALIGGALMGLVFAACASDGAGQGDVQPEGAPVAPEAAIAEAEPATGGEDYPESGLVQWRAVGEEDLVEPAVEPELASALEPAVEPAPAPEPEPAVVHEPPMSPQGQLGAIGPDDNALSQERYLTQPMPWDRGKVSSYRVSIDRDADRLLSLAARAKLRAFEGAPPTMPHSISFSAGSKTCLDCHNEGMTIGERVAHPMSHEPLANCSQCHVEEDGSIFEEELIQRDNSFEGLRYERKGESSISGAPPMMPHGTFMRTRCLSCHGEYGYPGLRTDHPRRVNCVQCHITDLRR